MQRKLLAIYKKPFRYFAIFLDFSITYSGILLSIVWSSSALPFLWLPSLVPGTVVATWHFQFPSDHIAAGVVAVGCGEQLVVSLSAVWRQWALN